MVARPRKIWSDTEIVSRSPDLNKIWPLTKNMQTPNKLASTSWIEKYWSDQGNPEISCQLRKRSDPFFKNLGGYIKIPTLSKKNLDRLLKFLPDTKINLTGS